MANSAIKITETDYDTLRTSLKSFLSSQTELLDYDFDSSLINTLINIMAYNTYHNSYWTNMNINESFLDSAQLRNNVVSRAKMLNYMPRSARGAVANVTVIITPSGSPTSISLAKNTKFTSTVDGVTYTFVNPVAYTIEPVDSIYSQTFEIVEGEPLSQTWNIKLQNPVKYILQNAGVDTTSIEVNVKESDISTTTTTYTEATDITTVASNSTVYFLQEVEDEKHEVYFGDGVIGMQLENENVLTIDYRVCNGTLLNGVNTFSGPSAIDGHNNYSITVNEKAAGGSNIETVESIKFNAPQLYSTQNRAVVKNDYERLIVGNFGYIDSVSVWGGEENDPPVFGSVYVAAKPKNGLLLSQTQKNEIVSFLDDFNVFSIKTVFVDARYLYIKPEITVRYNSNITTLTAQEVRTKVINAISQFESDNLGTFNSLRFEYSQFVRAIDDADPSIVSNSTNIKLQKYFVPDTDNVTTYNIAFNNTIRAPKSIGHVSHEGAHFISSSSFTIADRASFLDDDGEGIIRIYYNPTGTSEVQYTNTTAGIVDYTSGLITLESFGPTAYSGDSIEIEVEAASKDVDSVRNQILLFSDAVITVIDERDNSVAAKTVTATINGVNVAALDPSTNITVF